MSIYNLDETPDTFISITFDQGSHIYRMLSITGESNYSFICDIDLRKDKLIIHGTEIRESVWAKLHNYLMLMSKQGKIYVNCNGKCYIVIYTNNVPYIFRPIHNVIFDWSLFGVIVPNSVNDSFRKQLQQKDEEVAANKAGWEASKQGIEKLASQLSACRKEQLNKEMELQKVCSQLSVKEFEFDATKIKFELSKEEVRELQDQVSSSKKQYKIMEMEVQMLQHQLSSTISELNSTKVMWELSKEQLFSFKKENEEMKVKLQSMQDQVSSAVLSELKSTKIELESSSKNMEEQLLIRRKENQDIVTELQKIQNELSSGNLELRLTKIIELEEQLTTGEKVQDQLSFIISELESIKVMLDFTVEKEVQLEDKCFHECYVNKAIEIVDDQ